MRVQPTLSFGGLLLAIAIVLLLQMGWQIATSPKLDDTSYWISVQVTAWQDTMRYAWWHV